MAYEGKQWQCGDVIGAADLNRIERGIEAVGIETNIQNPTDGQTLKYDAESGKWVNGEGGGSNTLIVNNNNGTLDKTWQEIHDAMPAVFIVVPNASEQYGHFVTAAYVSDDPTYYMVNAIGTVDGELDIATYYAGSASGYPVRGNPFE